MWRDKGLSGGRRGRGWKPGVPILCALILMSATWAAAEDLAVTKVVDKPTPVTGDLVTYTITLKNAGPLTVTARVTDLLPPLLAFSGATPSQGTYDNATGLWNVGSVKKNVLYTLSIQAVVTADAAGTTIPNTAALTYTSRTDPKRDNNSATAVIRVQPTSATITEIRAAGRGGTVWVEWETAMEEGTVGFYLRRLNADTGLREAVGGFVPGLPGSPQGGTYRVADPGAAPGGTYEYWIEEVEIRGGRRTYGPFAVTVEPGEPLAAAGGELSVVACAGEKGGTPEFERHERPVSADKQERILARAAEQEAMQESLGDECGNQVKVFVTRDGLEYLDCPTLSGLLNLAESTVQQLVSGGGLQLRNNGQTATYIPASGGLYFYGQAPTNIYSDMNVYWLGSGRNPSPRTVSLKAPAPVSTSLTFADRIHAEQDRLATPAFFTDPEADAWMWGYLFGGFAGFDRMIVTTRVSGVASAGTATLVVRLFGGSSSGASPEHHVAVWVNGTPVGECAWAGLKPCELSVSFSQALLAEGDNLVEVRALLDAGVPYSIVYLDDVDLGYRRLYRAAGNQLLFRRDANKVVTVSGFTSPAISVYDLSKPLSPALVQGVRIDGGEGNYRVSLAPPSSTANYLAFTPDSVAGPCAMAAARPSCGLTSCSNRADYVIITVSELEGAAQALADYRGAQGHETRIVNLEDLYDAFNYGNASPWAIRRFLSHACYGWAQRPSYVVLAGEGTYDYKNHRGYGDNLLPTKVVSTPDGLCESDTWFADTSGEDGVPDVAIGRLPAATSAELQRLVDKIAAYEAASGDWASRVILAADNADSGGNFAADSDEFGLWVPAGYAVHKIYLTTNNALAARADLLAALNAGALLFNYIGHGVWDRLAQESLLANSHADTLANGEKLPVAVAMTCSSGRYSMPGYDCLGEHLVLRQGGGAVGFWGPTGLSMNDMAKRLDTAFLRARFAESETVLGDAILRAMDDYAAGGGDLYMLRIYSLLGDPALRVK